jgi:antitoxin component YwqK of YwqJK toxin-antitoxin module
VLNGTSTAYYENGKKKAEAGYKDGRLDGPSTSWNEQGVVQNTARFEEGRLVP